MIEAARPGDVRAIARLEAVALGRDAWSEGLIRDGVTGDLPTVHYLVARERGMLHGYAAASVVEDVAELQRIAVLPSNRRAGVATRLLVHVVTLARRNGAARVLLEVREDNAGARGFYEASGFEELARRPRYYRDGAAALVMELPLTGPDVKVWTTA